jgi:hypothetical protein
VWGIRSLSPKLVLRNWNLSAVISNMTNAQMVKDNVPLGGNKA